MSKSGFELPEWVDRTTWEDFEFMRNKLRKPLTDAARRLAVKKLLQIWQQHGHAPKEVLEQSILNGWQGLWPVCQGRTGQRDEELRKEIDVGQGPTCLPDSVKPEILKRIAAIGKAKVLSSGKS